MDRRLSPRVLRRCRRAISHDALKRGRCPQRAHHIAAIGERQHATRDSGGGSAAAATRTQAAIETVSRQSVQGVVGMAAKAGLWYVGLGNNQRAGSAKTRHMGIILLSTQRSDNSGDPKAVARPFALKRSLMAIGMPCNQPERLPRASCLSASLAPWLRQASGGMRPTRAFKSGFSVVDALKESVHDFDATHRSPVNRLGEFQLR